jgi:hypothetical protein
VANDKNRPYRQRQYARNHVESWVEDNNLLIIQHEAGHHIHYNIGLFPREVAIDPRSHDAIPKWIVEGTTMMFEVPPTAGGFGHTNGLRLLHLRHIYQNANLAEEVEKVKRFIVDNESWRTGNISDQYPKGWGLVYYLWKKHRKQYAQYLALVGARQVGVEVTPEERLKEFEDIFGTIDEAWLKEWSDYVGKLNPRRSTIITGLADPPEQDPHLR